jgi:hypothetical protein
MNKKILFWYFIPTVFGNSFELQALSSSQTETVFNDLLPDNDGVDDFLKSLDIPAQEYK